MGQIRRFRLSEASKDRILNAALVGSLLLLVSGFIRPSSLRRPSTPASSTSSVAVLRQLPVSLTEPYQELQTIATETEVNLPAATSATGQASLLPVSSGSAPPTSAAATSVSVTPLVKNPSKPVLPLLNQTLKTLRLLAPSSLL